VGHETAEDLFIRQRPRPSVGSRHGLVDGSMKVAQHPTARGLVNRSLDRSQSLSRLQLFEPL